jgi:Protein of unknown function (DUF2815)
MAERTVLKEVEFARWYSDNTILFKRVRASYPHIHTKGKDGKNKAGEIIPGRFGLVGMAPKKFHEKTKKLAVEVINHLMAEAKIAKIKPENKFFRDGDNSDKDVYEEHWLIACSESRPPKVRGSNNKILKPTDSESELIYGGAWCNILARPWVQNNEFGKRVNAGIVAYQVIPTPDGQSDEPFGEGTRISDDDVDETFDNEASEADWADDADDL